MSNIEFISAKDLPISEAEEVDVLCVENGELKRKEGASLGGGNYDAKVKTWWDSYEETMKIELVEGTYDALVEKINNELVTTALVVTDIKDAEHMPPMKIASIVPLGITTYDFDGVAESALAGRDSLADSWFFIRSDNTVIFD